MSRQFAARADSRFEFQNRRQLFIGTHNVAVLVTAMCVSNPNGSFRLRLLII